jgi:hypothetical protein
VGIAHVDVAAAFQNMRGVLKTRYNAWAADTLVRMDIRFCPLSFFTDFFSKVLRLLHSRSFFLPRADILMTPWNLGLTCRWSFAGVGAAMPQSLRFWV